MAILAAIWPPSDDPKKLIGSPTFSLLTARKTNDEKNPNVYFLCGLSLNPNPGRSKAIVLYFLDS